MNTAILLCAEQERNYRRDPEAWFLSEGDSLTGKPAFSVIILELKPPWFSVDFTGLLSIAFLVFLINQWLLSSKLSPSRRTNVMGSMMGVVCCHASPEIGMKAFTVAANTEPTVWGLSVPVPKVPSHV